jgi:phosphate-selective porin OprO/OprP
MSEHRTLLNIVTVLLAPVLTGALSAQPASEIEILKSELAALTQRLNQLEANQTQTDDSRIDANEKPQASPKIQLDEKGLRLKSSNGNYSLNLNGGLQLDSRHYIDSKTDTDTFEIRRARPSLSGKLFDNWDWRVQYDFDSTSVFDAYLRYRYSSALQIKVGKQKTSVGLERIQSWTNTPFPERSLTSNLTPTRDNGIQLSGKILGSKVLYEVALFNGASNDSCPDTDSGNNKTLSARLFVTPWINSKDSPLRGLGFGLAGSYGDESGALPPSHRTTARSTFFSYNEDVLAIGTHQRINPNFYFYKNTFGLLGEMIFDTESFVRSGNKQKVDTVAWSITPSWVLTGGRQSFTGVELAHGASLSEGGKGAWLIAARYTSLKLSDNVYTGSSMTQLASPATTARAAESHGLSLSWYPNPNLRVIFAYDHTNFSKGAELDDEDACITRLQFSF